MALAELRSYADHLGLKLISIADLIRYRLGVTSFCMAGPRCSRFGSFQAVGYRNELDGSERCPDQRCGQP